MNWLEFISSIVASIAWPCAVAISVLVLKDEIRSVIQNLRLTKLKLKDFEAEFAEAVDAVEKEFSDPEFRRIVTDEPVPENSQELINLDPNYAVLDTWKELEHKLVELSVSKYQNPRQWSVRRHTIDLVKREAIPPEMAAALEDLNSARNQIVHEKNFKLEKSSALKFIDLAADVVGYLNKLM